MTEIDPTELGKALLKIWEQADHNHKNYSAQATYEADLQFFALGVAGESGEFANFVKKRTRDGTLYLQEMRYETSDILAYTLMAARHLGMTPLSLINTVAEKQNLFVKKQKKLRRAKI